MAVATGICGSGCRDQDAPPTDIPPARTASVELYGQSLGPEATPQEVTFALLRLLRDDVKASQKRDAQEHKRLLAQQLQLSAPRRIYQNQNPAANVDAVDPTTMNNGVYKIVNLWAPIVSRYIHNFTDDSAAMTAAMRSKALSNTETRISFDVTDPDDQSRATLQVFLVQEPGTDKAQHFWRVQRLGYAPLNQDDVVIRASTTRQAVPASSAPATQPAAK